MQGTPWFHLRGKNSFPAKIVPSVFQLHRVRIVYLVESFKNYLQHKNWGPIDPFGFYGNIFELSETSITLFKTGEGFLPKNNK